MKNKNTRAKSGKTTVALQKAVASNTHASVQVNATSRKKSVAVDRPGFDLGGSTGKTHAGMGVGLGPDASEKVEDRSLPGRHIKPTVKIPRWSGPDGSALPPASKK